MTVATKASFSRTVCAAIHAEWLARAARATSVRALEHDWALVHEAALATAAADRAWELVRCGVPPVAHLADRTRSGRRRMSDCCFMSLVGRKEHQTVFEAIGFRLEEERPDGTVYMIDEQASYANDSDLRALAGKGIPFHAENGPGGEYGDGRYACDGRRVVQVNCMHGGEPAVEIGEDGEPDADQMHAVHDYYSVLAAAKKAMVEGLPPGRRWKSADEILKGMDPALFREQRRSLRWIIEDAGRNITRPISAADVDLLDGLESMLDDVADYAHDVLGLDCLLEEPSPAEPEGG